VKVFTFRLLPDTAGYWTVDSYDEEEQIVVAKYLLAKMPNVENIIIIHDEREKLGSKWGKEVLENKYNLWNTNTKLEKIFVRKDIAIHDVNQNTRLYGATQIVDDFVLTRDEYRH